MLGNRDSATFRRLYDKVKHLKDCIVYTDDWGVFSDVLSRERHTVSIERDNSNTRHHLGRFTRRTKVVSRSERTVDITLKLWCALTSPEIFRQFQSLAISISGNSFLLLHPNDKVKERVHK